ncbi:MAG: alpha-amylase [Treponema sp.]|nr:alpha-amylase [Treponema sp.]
MNDNRFDTVFTAEFEKKSFSKYPLFEFHVSREIRERCQFDGMLFATTGNVILANLKNVRLFAKKINDIIITEKHPEKMIKAGQLNAMGLIDEIFHYVCFLYRKDIKADVFVNLLKTCDEQFGKKNVNGLLLDFIEAFPPNDVYNNVVRAENYLENVNSETGISNRVTTLEEMILLRLANENPAFQSFSMLFSDKQLAKNPIYKKLWQQTKEYFKTQPKFGPKNNDLISMLKEPVVYSPTSLKGQLDYIRTYWGDLLGDWLKRLLAGIDLISEEEKPAWRGLGGGDLPPMEAYSYDYLTKEYERYSPDKDWMPRVVLIAKTVLVWLNQLSDKYQCDISRLDQIPDEELDLLAQRGFTGLWLIGLWERSRASRRIKQINGNPEAAASAYSLEDYDIASNLGGWEALDNLRYRLWQRRIRLASDMVPNHTGMDAKWVIEKPDFFIQRRDCPFPTYTFNGENLSHDGRVGIYLEDHYYQKTDCAVVFKRVDNYTGDVRYIYHGNDGTGMPWNDTAQIDFLNPEAREAVIQKILHVARNFPIIRFDAAMVLAKKHIKRLWYPEHGSGGDIATRSESALSREEFEERIPNEFWREVVDRCAKEIPDTLLLAEAFWMMEGYFVRTLGMHRVYNSAFMNMLKKEENYKYRQTVKNTLEFDPQVLRRFVNFMNNPDEETAVAQFGKGDKYFGICTLMVTMPGLPMFGHGQIEGFAEKYGMEYQKAYWKETPDYDLIERHNREIFPLMKKRYLFAEVDNFYFYDVWNNGYVNENVFAYSNTFGEEKVVVFYNNVYQQAVGWIKESCRFAVKTGTETMEQKTCSIGTALKLSTNSNVFCLFREQRSGLWYIRTCKEIHEQGLFLSLNGFESQVLLDFTQVTDDETGRYRILYETLGGRGVEDIEIAMQEIFLKELYQPLKEFASKDLFEEFRYICTPSIVLQKSKIIPKKCADILKKAKPFGVAYFAKLAEFIRGNYGATQLLKKEIIDSTVDAEKIWKNFATEVTRIAKFKELAEKPNENLTRQEVSYIRDLYETLLSKQCGAEYALIFAMLNTTKLAIGKKATAFDSAVIARNWGLNRKLFTLLKEITSADSDTYIAQRQVILMLALCDTPVLYKTEKEGAFEVISALFNDKDSYALTGLNTYNNVRWFGKEQMEDSVSQIVFAQGVVHYEKAGFEKLNSFKKMLNSNIKAAGYNADDLLKKLELPKPKTAVKKSVSKRKPTAKKTEEKKLKPKETKK